MQHEGNNPVRCKLCRVQFTLGLLGVLALAALITGIVLTL